MQISQIHHDPKRSEYHLQVDEHRAYVQYRDRNGKRYLTYSFVPPALRGQGIGKILVEQTVAHIRAEGVEIVPVCSFIAVTMQRMKG